MKTPREVLLQRHENAKPKLDVVRRGALAHALHSKEDEKSQTGSHGLALRERFWITVWEELVRPSRFAWGGMAAVWMALLVINGAMKEPQRIAQKRTPSDKAMVLQSIAEEKRLLAELLQAENKPTPVRTEKVPSPRSERTMVRERKFV